MGGLLHACQLVKDFIECYYIYQGLNIFLPRSHENLLFRYRCVISYIHYNLRLECFIVFSLGLV